MIAIVTDSTAPVTRQEAEKYGICIVPHSYQVNGTTYLENYTDQNYNYTQRLTNAGNHTATNQCTSSAFAVMFEHLLSQGYEVLCIVISSRLSGAWNSAVTAAREIGGDKIAVVDSLTTAGGLYYQIMRARELADTGISLDKLASYCAAQRSSVGLGFSVEDMHALRRSRRLGPLSQSVTTILNCRPIFLVQDGTIVYKELARGRANRIRMLSALVPQNAQRIMVQGFGTMPIASSLAHMLQQHFPQIEIQRKEVGPVLSIHIGMQALAVSWCLN